MLLQTNSYIVPRDKRVEHARLLRRFRQTLLRLGCDHFEVYEQVGPNWNTSETTGRYVQIMRFRDRKHQMEVQAAERTDKTAQALVQEFCDLVNFSYQQQQGLFAVGFYTSFLRMPSNIVATSAAQPRAEQGESAQAGEQEPAGFVEVVGHTHAVDEDHAVGDTNGQEDQPRAENEAHAEDEAHAENAEAVHDEPVSEDSGSHESSSDESLPSQKGLTPGGSGRMSDTGSQGLGVLSMPGLSDQPQEPLDGTEAAHNEVDLNDQAPLDLDDSSILQDLVPFSDDDLGLDESVASDKDELGPEDFIDPEDRAASSKS
jgi:hypothetical protein